MPRLLFLALLASVTSSFSLAQNLVVTNDELRIEVNGSGVKLDIYMATTGQPVWSGNILETGSSPDAGFNVVGTATSSLAPMLPAGLLVLRFTQATLVPCATSPCEPPLAQPVTYAWAGNPAPLTVGSFYRPADTGTNALDLDVYLDNGALRLKQEDARFSIDVTTALGAQGWALPYDRETLCASGTCSPNPTGSSGPAGQFLAAGVTTTTVSGSPGWRRLVPTFTFRGRVILPTQWPNLTWAVPGLRLRFQPTALLGILGGLNGAGGLKTVGTTLTAADASAGWYGVEQAGSNGYSEWTASTVVEHVRSPMPGQFGGGAIRAFSGYMIIDNCIIRDPLPYQIIVGVYSAAGAQVVVRNGTLIERFPVGALYADGGSWIRAWGLNATYGNGIGPGTTIQPVGIWAASATIWISDSDLIQIGTNDSRGAQAVGRGQISFGRVGLGQGPITGENTRIVDSGRVDIYANNGIVTGGTAPDDHKNSFMTDYTHVDATAGSSVRLLYDYWGQSTGPELSRVVLSSDSKFEYCPWITSPGGPPWTGGCSSTEASANGWGEDDEDPLVAALAALDDQTASHVFAAVDSLWAAGAMDSVMVERAIPIVSSGLRIGESEEGYDLLARLIEMSGEGARTASGADAPVDTRLAQSRALAALRSPRDVQDALAAELRADAGTRPVGHALEALSRLQEGDGTGAITATVAARRALTERHDAATAEFVEGAVQSVSVFTGWRPEGASPPPVTLDGSLFRTELVLAPNPTRGEATVSVGLASEADVEITLYDLLGRRLAGVSHGQRTAGVHEFAVPIGRHPGGVYVVRVTARAGSTQDVRTARLMFLR